MAIDPSLQIKVIGGVPQWNPSLPKILRRIELNHKCCKDVVKTEFLIANPCFIRDCETATIEWE
jgi:hypothetical protein